MRGKADNLNHFHSSRQLSVSQVLPPNLLSSYPRLTLAAFDSGAAAMTTDILVEGSSSTQYTSDPLHMW